MRNPSKKSRKRLMKAERYNDPIEPLDYNIQGIRSRVLAISKGKLWNNPVFVSSVIFWEKMIEKFKKENKQ